MNLAEAVGDPSLAEEVATRSVSALRRAYSSNTERFDESVGDDPLTFGVQVWRNSWFQLEIELSQIRGVNTSRPKGSLAISVGRAILHPYKVGSTENVNLDHVTLSGTITKERIAASNSQLTLFEEGEESESGDIRPINLVLAHSGNPFDGLCAVWTGAPTLNDEGPAWAWIEPIFRIAPEEIRRTAEPPIEMDFLPYAEMPLSEIDLSLVAPEEVKPEAED